MCCPADRLIEGHQKSPSNLMQSSMNTLPDTGEVCGELYLKMFLSFVEEHSELLVCYQLMDLSTVEEMRDEFDDVLQSIAGDKEMQIKAVLEIFKKHLKGAIPNVDAGMWLAWQSFVKRESKSIALEQGVLKLQKELAAWKHQPKKGVKEKKEHRKEIQKEEKASNPIDDFIYGYTSSARTEKQRKIREDVVRHLQENCRLFIRNGRLEVHNDVILEGNIVHGLEELPDICRVKGNLSLNGTDKKKSALKSLPKELEVTGDLILKNCFDLAALPEKLAVGGSLILNLCSKLTTVPATTAVQKNIIFFGCENLTEFPLYRVNGTLNIFHCPVLTRLPKRLVVRRNITLMKCSDLTALPEKLTVGGSLKVKECDNLTTVPATLKVRKSINFVGCRNLTTFPLCEVNGSLNFRECPMLSRLPEELDVGDDLDLSSCVKLVKLPKGLQVGGDLDLSDCIKLAKLPKGLHVGGNLDLSNCVKLTKLPKGLVVGDTLNLRGCPAPLLDRSKARKSIVR